MNNYQSAWDRCIVLTLSILRSLQTCYLLLFWWFLWSPTSWQFDGIYSSPCHRIQTACRYIFPLMIRPYNFVWDRLSSPHIMWEGAHHAALLLMWTDIGLHGIRSIQQQVTKMREIFSVVPHELFNLAHSNLVINGVFNNVTTPPKINIRRYERQNKITTIVPYNTYGCTDYNTL